MPMKRCLIIAEAGVNHNGSINLAKKLVDVAAEAGADIVKFQTFKANKLVSRFAKKAEYQIANMKESDDDTQLGMLKKLELSEENHLLLMDYCRQKGIQFLSTGFDVDSLQYLARLGIKIAKVPSGEVTNLPYLRTVANFFSEVIMSTGMSELKEVQDAIAVLTAGGIKKENITVLHCNTEYPTPFHDVNLRAMNGLQKKLDIAVGYSDHTSGIEVPIGAVALGASVIEKHFTLDRNMEGPDHKASLEPDELKAMVAAIRNIEKALGEEEKRPSPSEIKNRSVARKSIVAASFIKTGELFSEANLTAKRPGDGISPMLWDDVIGRVAKKDFDADDLIEL
jgi:N,N'-diacetyllegionaminate synthase